MHGADTARSKTTEKFFRGILIQTGETSRKALFMAAQPQHKLGFEWRSEAEVGGLPLVHVALGKNPQGRWMCVRGVVAIGQFAKGVVCISQFGVGIVCISQFSLAAVSVAQFSIALLAVSQFGIFLHGIAQYPLGILS